MKAKKCLPIIPLVLIFVLLLFIIFFVGKEAEKMTPYEYLSHIVPPEERFVADDGSVWYRTAVHENHSRIEQMAPVAERAEQEYLTMNVQSSNNGTLYVTVENQSKKNVRDLKSQTYVSVKLADGEWYPIPVVDCVYVGELEAGEKDTAIVELRQKAGSKYSLPSGEYRFEYYSFDSEIIQFRFTVAEFKLKHKFGRYWIM